MLGEQASARLRLEVHDRGHRCRDPCVLAGLYTWTALVRTSLRGSCSVAAGCWPRVVRLEGVRGRSVDVPVLVVDGG